MIKAISHLKVMVGAALMLASSSALTSPYLYYTAGQSVYVNDAITGEQLNRIDMLRGTFTYARQYDLFSESHDGQHLYVAGKSDGTDSWLKKIDIETGNITELGFPGLDMNHITKSKVDDYLYYEQKNSTTADHEIINKLDPNSGIVVGSYTLIDEDFSLNGISVSPTGDKLYVFLRTRAVEGWLGRIRVFDTTTMKPITDLRLPYYHRFHSDLLTSKSGDKAYFTTNYNKIGVVDLVNDTLEMHEIAGGNFSSLGKYRRSIDGDELFYTPGGGSIQVIDLNNFELLTTINLPTEFEFSPYGILFLDFTVHPSGDSLLFYGWDFNMLDGVFYSRLLTTNVDLATSTADPAATPIYTEVGSSLGPTYMMYGQWSANLQLSSEGVSANQVRCTNHTTGQFFDISILANENTWSCTGHGLLATPGDDISMSVRGNME